MRPPDVPVIAEGEIPSGERWSLMAGGTSDDYYVGLKTVHQDGHADGGGMQGPALSAGIPFKFCLSQNGDEPLSVMVCTESRVRSLRLGSPGGESCDLLPVAEDQAVGVTFFVALLPWKASTVSMEGFDGGGQYERPLRNR
ncbi:hypothetical protein EAS64_11895 [Trebonia kvetii]|uniref:Uncharacterized protein n=1 Tax=Trebonia kvetii TaxID=2480626 RepID=A0A6P2C268_9ACTN|nr:hypothetical protein [Trebonia kvetii]TVZ05278.1 hypothetical protein EAS64_11895 [Trebonia kvetii]